MEIFSVVSYNLEKGGSETDTSVEKFVTFFKENKFDIIGLQEVFWNFDESKDIGKRIANELNMSYVYSGVWGVSLLTSFPIVEVKTNESICSLVCKTKHDLEISVYNVHLDAYPTSYTALKGVFCDEEDKEITNDTAMEVSFGTKKEDIMRVLDNCGMKKETNRPTIIMGDFNEPSDMDWTSDTTKKGLTPCVIKWKASELMREHGFIDACRSLYANPVLNPFYSCDVFRTSISKPVPERIDYIYYRSLEITSYRHFDNKYSDHLPIASTFMM